MWLHRKKTYAETSEAFALDFAFVYRANVISDVPSFSFFTIGLNWLMMFMNDGSKHFSEFGALFRCTTSQLSLASLKNITIVEGAERSATVSAFRIDGKNAWTLAALVASSEEGESARAVFDAFLRRLGNRVAFRGRKSD